MRDRKPAPAASPGAAFPIARGALPAFRRALLAWYDKNRRDLPWRGTTDPYAIWLSEIMLQQTRVAAVLDHYRVFLDRFPNVAALAAAPENAVLAAWSGLGYYRRARMLHQCAQEIANRHNGRFPQTAEALRSLPGIGRYTAAAIASIAFHEPVAVVDGNVERVLQRLADANLTPSRVWAIAEKLLVPARAGDFNQAMMELGATVCPPREPRCLLCPVRRWCKAQGEIQQPKIQQLRPVARQQRKELWCLLDRRNGHVRLTRRAKSASLMPGMWELPQWPELPHASAQEALWRTFHHSITVTDYNVHVLRNWPGNRGEGKTPAKATTGKWIAIAKIPTLPLTGLTRKILRADGII